MKEPLIFALWFIIFMVILTITLKLISAPNTTENLLGVVILIVTVVLSFKTQFLTKIKFKK